MIKPKNWCGQHVTFYQPKFDGYRVKMILDKDGNFTAQGRKQEYDLKNLFEDEIDHTPYDTIIDGELYLPNHPATDVINAIKNQDKRLKYIAFGLPKYKGMDTTKMGLQSALSTLHRMHWDVIPTYIYKEETEEELIKKAIKNNLEGYVLKDEHYSGWYKVKPQRTVDVVITGVKYGTGKNVHQIGSLEVSLINYDGLLVSMASVAGITDDEREEMTELHEDGLLIGKICEVRYQSIGSKGRLQFPSFVRFRDEKSKSECSFEQL